MEEKRIFLDEMAGMQNTERRLWRPCLPSDIRCENGVGIIVVPFKVFKPRDARNDYDETIPAKDIGIVIRAYGENIVRMTAVFDGMPLSDENPMMDWDIGLKQQHLSAVKKDKIWELIDENGRVRLRVDLTEEQFRICRTEKPKQKTETFSATFLPDGSTEIPLLDWDFFMAGQAESFPIAFTDENGKGCSGLFALHAANNECFAGTGERFAGMNLSGKTVKLKNTDAVGSNTRRAYKNVPFYISSRMYGLFIHTTHQVKLSFADISTKTVQGSINEPIVDLYFIGGGSIERIVYEYRRLTGFPPQVPDWSYGVWMSRVTYRTAEEVLEIAHRLRNENYPCDVIHIDTGWFETDWGCDWKFGSWNFPDPEGFLSKMKELKYNVTLWQHPRIATGTDLVSEAIDNKHVALAKGSSKTGSEFTRTRYIGNIDFTREETTKWYQDKIKDLIKKGVSTIKADFGETFDMNLEFENMSAEALHNIYCILYQKAVFEAVKEVSGESIIWARAGWAGCQRYPVHWGGDTVGSWDGMSSVLKGGLHLGLSGYAFWSHDVPGFYGCKDFFHSWQSDELYMRWTQFGVFSSHIRYHGHSHREPFHRLDIADNIRKWWKLRYALIPYIIKQGQKCTNTGLPMLRALIFHHYEDKNCWYIDDMYYFGDDFIVAPVMNAGGTRDVYLPKGKWVDFWTGEKYDITVGQWMTLDNIPLDQMPLYARHGALIPVCAQNVLSTKDIDFSQIEEVRFDESYLGVSNSLIGKVTGIG